MVKRMHQTIGPAARVLMVLLMFVVVPVGVWWSATPMIGTLKMSDDVRHLLTLAVLATLVFGCTSGFLVLKELAREP